jgi:hypothetical protein
MVAMVFLNFLREKKLPFKSSEKRLQPLQPLHVFVVYIFHLQYHIPFVTFRISLAPLRPRRLK